MDGAPARAGLRLDETASGSQAAESITTPKASAVDTGIQMYSIRVSTFFSTASTPDRVSNHHIASWRLRAPWLAAIAFALVPVVFTAGASAASQLSEATEIDGALLLAASAAASAILGLIVMRLSRPTLRDYPRSAFIR